MNGGTYSGMSNATKTASHTPGPWITGGCSGRMITTPSGYVGDGFIADADTLANARLIAAAPEMLFALQEIVEAYIVANINRIPMKVDADKARDHLEQTPMIREARAIIAKATGSNQ